METTNKQNNALQEKSYNGCLETLLVWWIIGGFITLIWNAILLFTQSYNAEGYLAISLMLVSDVVAIYGLFQLKQYKAIGFYLAIGSSILDIIIACVWPHYLLASNPLMRSIFSIILLVVLLRANASYES